MRGARVSTAALLAWAAHAALAALPGGWTLNTYRHYQPLATATAATNAEGVVSIALTNVQGVSGTRVVRERAVAVQAGDVVALAFEARGKGGLVAEFFSYDAKGGWNPPLESAKGGSARLKDEWRQYRIHYRVTDGKRPVRQVKPVLGCAKGGEVEFRNVSAFRVEVPSAVDAAAKRLLAAPEERFDAATAGWKLVFEDAFDAPAGAPLDSNRWEIASWRRNGHMARHDGKGHLALACDFAPGTNLLVSTSAWTRQGWLYGCFEARLKFTRNNGWWSSFWLYGWSNNNPFEDGAEIDVYEDAHTRMKPPSPVHLFSTLHMYHQPFDGGTLKSFSHSSTTPESADGFHTVACRWTPLEISIYVDGRRTGTFNAFEHGAVAAPLHALLSGCIMKSWGNRDTAGFTFPEHLVVDYVRVYEWPRDAAAPKVEWAAHDDRIVRHPGETLAFEAAIAPGTGGDPVVAAYLFDSGYLVAAAEHAPWRFELPFTAERYGATAYMGTGSQYEPPNWTNTLHAFRVFAVDAKGRVGVTPVSERRLLKPYVDTFPGPGGVQRIPGKVAFAGKPDGARGSMRTGTGVACDVEIAEAGEYEAVLRYASIHDDQHHILMLLDGRQVADVRCTPSPQNRYVYRDSPPLRVRLPRGRHRLTFVSIGFMHAGPMTFTRIR